jgi:hypothetical protein
LYGKSLGQIKFGDELYACYSQTNEKTYIVKGLHALHKLVKAGEVWYEVDAGQTEVAA